MSAGLVVGKMMQSVDSDKLLRSINVNFCGPLLCDVDFSIELEVLSEGKNTTQITGRCIQEGKTVTIITACFGKGRYSAIDIQDKKEIPEAGSGSPMGYFKGLTPEFVQHVQFTYNQGQFPFSNSPLNEIEGWMRYNESAQSLTIAHIVMLIDAWPPTALQKLNKFTPCSTISWNVDFVQPITELSGHDWLHYHAHIQQSHQGYVMTEADVRHPNGELIARSRQMIGLYEKAPENR